MDALVRGMSTDDELRVVAAITTAMVQEGCRRRGCTGVEAVILGRALTAGALLSTLTKLSEERLRVDLFGGGRVGHVVIDSLGDGSGRACTTRTLPRPPLIPVPGPGERLSVAPWVGREGALTVTRDIGLENPYQGSVPLVTGEIDEDLEDYLNRSEQLPSALRCAVVLGGDGHVLHAGGVLVQTFPGADAGRIDAVRVNLRGNGLETLLQRDREPEELMGFALLGEPIAGATSAPLRFHCPCTPERAIGVLSSLGAEDLDALAGERPQGTEVRCEFCGQRYDFTATALRELSAQLRATLS
jgi:molecular chaperone Hsp33